MSLEPQVPSSARFWNACLGGKNNFAVDQELVAEMERAYPGLRGLAHASRGFLRTAVEFLVDRGITQFIDLGAGLPTDSNTHQIAEEHAPSARVVYVDNDPVVLADRALLTGNTGGRTAYLDLDFFHREQVLEEAGRTLDLTRPVGLLWMSTLGHVAPDQAPVLVRDYLSALPSGSYLALCDTLATDDSIHDANVDYAASGTPPYTARSRGDFEAIAAGYEVVWPLQALPDHQARPTEQYGLIIRT